MSYAKMFPGYTAVTCPCCDRYRHYEDSELDGLAPRRPDDDCPESVICEDCWEVFQEMMAKVKLPVECPS